jgi:hypothetical protein
MGWTVPPHPAYSPDLAPSHYHLFGPVKHALCGCHFEDNNKLKQSVHDVLKVYAGNFTTMVYNALFNVGKSVLKTIKTL